MGLATTLPRGRRRLASRPVEASDAAADGGHGLADLHGQQNLDLRPE